jgi:hypothetical protein
MRPRRQAPTAEYDLVLRRRKLEKKARHNQWGQRQTCPTYFSIDNQLEPYSLSSGTDSRVGKNVAVIER